MSIFSEPANRQQQEALANILLRFLYLGLSILALFGLLVDVNTTYNLQTPTALTAALAFISFILLSKFSNKPTFHLFGFIWILYFFFAIVKNGYLPTPLLPFVVLLVLLSYRGRFRLILPFLIISLFLIAVSFSEGYIETNHIVRIIISSLFIVFPLNHLLDKQSFNDDVKATLFQIIAYQFIASQSLLVLSNRFFEVPFPKAAVFALIVGVFFVTLIQLRPQYRLVCYKLISLLVIIGLIATSFFNGLFVSFLYIPCFLIFFVLLRNSIATLLSFGLLIFSSSLYFNQGATSIIDNVISYQGYYSRFLVSNLLFISTISALINFLNVDNPHVKFPSLLKFTLKSIVIFCICFLIIAIAHHGFDGHIIDWPHLSGHDMNILTMNLMLVFCLTWIGLYFLDMFENLNLLSTQLEAKNDLLSETLESKDRFLAKVNHELRTPLNGILGCIQIIESHDLDEKTHKFLTVMKHSSHHLLYMVEDIMDLTAIKNNKLKLVIEPVNFYEVVNDSIILVQSLSVNKLGFHCFIDPNIPEIIVSDTKRLTQILINLLNNAVKFTKSGSITVKCQLDQVSNLIRIDIIDTGIGIEEYKLRSIFNDFEQVESVTTRSYDGLGIGLALVADLVNLLDGKIEVESIPGVGSTFSVFIPYFAVNDLNAATKSSQYNGGFDDLTVVIVDDQKVNLMVLEKMLQHEGVKVFAFENPLEAIAFTEQQILSINAIFTDLDMPIMDGHQFRQRIHSLDSSLPVFAVTGNLVTNANNSILNEFSGFITKPINKKLLQKYLEMVKNKSY